MTQTGRPATAPAGRDRVAVSGPELEALRLAVHRPEEVASRLERNLFAHPLAGAAFDALSAAGTFHDAVEAADPQAAELLQRLAVEESDADPDDIMIRLVERATQRALRDLQAEMRQADQAGQAEYAPTVAWLKLALETMRSDDASRTDAAVDAEERLVGWLVARDQRNGPHGGERMTDGGTTPFTPEGELTGALPRPPPPRSEAWLPDAGRPDQRDGVGGADSRHHRLRHLQGPRRRHRVAR